VNQPEQQQHIKVGFSGADGVVERLWATHVEGDLYRLDNAPAFAFGVSLHDVVELRPRSMAHSRRSFTSTLLGRSVPTTSSRSSSR